MKIVRPLLITLGVVLVIFAIGLVLVLTPSVQRWAVLRAAAKEPGLKLDVSRVSAGVSLAKIDGVQLEQDGLKVQVEHAEVEYAIWPLVFKERLVVRKLSAIGLVIDASHTSQDKAKATVASAPASPGLLAQIKLPFELVLDDCQVAGRVLLPGATGQPPLDATFEVKGGKFAPGEEGSLQLAATVKNPEANAHVGSLHVQVNLRAVQSSVRDFSRVNLTAVIDAEGKALSEQNQLKITSTMARETTGENYSLSIDTVTQGAAENLLALKAGLPTGKTDYTGQWTLKARNKQLEPFFLGLPLPDFDASGEGGLSFSPANQGVGLQGKLQAGASRLEVLNPVWKAIGAVKLQTQFDVTSAGGIAHLRQLNVRLDGAKPVLELSASQAAEINFKERRLRIGGMAANEALNLKLHGLPIAWIEPFVPGLKISGGAVTGQYSITGNSERLVLHAVQPLRIDQLSIVQGQEAVLSKSSIALSMDAVLTEKDLEAKISELVLQTAAGDMLKAQAQVSIPVSPNPAVTVKANYTADLPTLVKPWIPQAQLKATGEADVTWIDGKLEVRRFVTTQTDSKGAFLFKAASLRAFTYDLATGKAAGDKSPADLLQISLGRLPLDWLPVTQPNTKLAGYIEPAEFILKVNGDELSLRAVTPLKISGVGLNQDGADAFNGLSIESTPEFKIAAGSLTTASTGEVSIRNASGAMVLTLKGEASQSPAEGMRTTATFNLEIPALAAQPLFADAQKVSQGKASGEFRGSVKDGIKQAEARLTLNSLVSRDSGQLLPVANLSLRAVIQDDGKISVQAPLLLDRAGQRSDINFAINFTPSGRNFTLDGKLSGDHVELSDALAVAGVFSTSAARSDKPAVVAAPAKTAGKPAPDATSAWSKFNGQLSLDIKSVASGKEWSMNGLTGLVAIDASAISLQKLDASFGDKSQLKAKGAIRFTSGAQPYQLNGDFSLTEFDVGKFFKAIDPSKAPTVEGLFTVAGKINGQGETLDQTIEKTHGQFELTSRQGVFRGLQRVTSKVSMATKAIDLVGSLFGSEKASKTAEKVAGQAYYIDQLAQGISEFNYDQLSVKLVRDESLNLAMQDVSLISPEIRLIGKGTISYVAGKRLLDQPMNISLSLGARGKIEQLLGKLHLIEETRDEVGYAKTKETLILGGSLSRPDPTAFFTKIAAAKLSDFLESE